MTLAHLLVTTKRLNTLSMIGRVVFGFFATSSYLTTDTWPGYILASRLASCAGFIILDISNQFVCTQNKTIALKCIERLPINFLFSCFFFGKSVIPMFLFLSTLSPSQQIKGNCDLEVLILVSTLCLFIFLSISFLWPQYLNPGLHTGVWGIGVRPPSPLYNNSQMLRLF